MWIYHMLFFKFHFTVLSISIVTCIRRDAPVMSFSCERVYFSGNLINDSVPLKKGHCCRVLCKYLHFVVSHNCVFVCYLLILEFVHPKEFRTAIFVFFNNSNYVMLVLHNLANEGIWHYHMYACPIKEYRLFPVHKGLLDTNIRLYAGSAFRSDVHTSKHILCKKKSIRRLI